MITARQYQVEAEAAIWNYFREHAGNPVVAMPTGTGKSVVIGMFCWNVLRTFPGQRILVLTHVKELIEQNYLKLLTLWPGAPAGVYSAGLNRRDVNKPITFAGIASVAKRAHLFGHVDLVLIDEAHLVSPSESTMYQKFIGELLQANPFLKVIGFTATPWRLGHGKITEGEESLFTDLCFDITDVASFNRLIAEGYLAPLVPRPMKQILDIEGVHVRGGELLIDELQAAVDKFEITKAAMMEMAEVAADRKHWLIFSSGVEHAEHIAEVLNDMDIPSVAIHSKMGGDAVRDAAIRDIKSGRFRAAVNNNVLTTGFDFPAIDAIGVMRPTLSAGLWVQMLGRGTRPSPDTGKVNCLVLDFARNTLRLGPINDPVIPKKKGDKGGTAPVKLCSACETYNHASVRFCAYCGQEFKFSVKFGAEASSQELIKGELPVVEQFDVTHITYTQHEKVGRPPMMKVSYYCGARVFKEYVCFEHEGYAGRKARQWWNLRANGLEFPGITANGLALAPSLRAPTGLRVWVNTKYPEIMEHLFTEGVQPPVATPRTATGKGGAHLSFDDMDDDIPF